MPSTSRSFNRLGSLDDALEYVIKTLESNEDLDREALIASFPQWADELNQFIDNWLAMEQQTAPLFECPTNTAHSEADDLRGTIVGDYELLELVKTGGMGAVYRARQISLGRIVALKMVLNAVRDKTRFRIEAEAAASLHHANIVAIHEVGEFQGQPFLSMQFIAGGNLHDYLSTGPMSPRSAASLVRTIANAVHYAHQRGILHRDLKPANVLLDVDRRPFVSDFGLAKQIGNSVELTRSGAIIGTPGYMAPEQAMGQVKSITVAADVYGLGAILYAALTGDAPFKTDSDLLTLRKVIEEPPVSPRTKRPEVDRNLETICLKCLEKTPASRYGSARQLVDDLTRYLQGEPVTARPVGFIERRWRWCIRNPALATLSFFAGLLLTCVVFLSLSMAWREYNTRMNAQFTVIREAAMAEAVELARVDAESKSQEAREAISELYTTNGLWAARTDLLGESLLWFAQAADLKNIPAAYIKDSQTRCLSWLSQSPKPVAARQLSSPLQASTFQADWPNWHLSSMRTEVMFKSGDDFGIWNFKSDEIWRPGGKGFVVRSAAWSNDGRLLALGSESGEMRMLDALTKASRAIGNFDSPVSNIAFSFSGDRLAVSLSNRVAIVSAQDLSIEREWKVATPCLSLTFSNDDKLLSVATDDNKVSIYRCAGDRDEPIMQAPSYSSKRNPFAQPFTPVFSLNSAQLLVRSDEQRLRILDIATGKQVGPSVVTGSTHCVALAPDQACCAAGGDGYARAQSIKWKNGVPSFIRHDSRLTHDDAVTGVAFGGNSLVATASRDRLVKIWSVGEEKLPGGLLNERAIPLACLAHTSDIRGLLFAEDGSQLVTMQSDGLIRVWQLPSFEPPGYVARATKGGSTIKVVGDDRWLIAGSSYWGSNVVNASLRRIKDGVVLAETPLSGLNERGHLLDAAITSDQQRLISLHASHNRSESTMIDPKGGAGSIQVWEFPDGRAYGQPIGLEAEPRAVALHPDGAYAAVLLVNMDIVIVDMANPCVVETLPSRPENLHTDAKSYMNLHNGQLQFSRDGSCLYAWGIGKGFSVWDWHKRVSKFSCEFADSWTVHLLATSPTDNQFAVADDQHNRLILMDASKGDILRQIDQSTKIRSIEFSPSGKEVMVGCDDGRARIFDASNPSTKSSDLVHNKQVLDACFSPDGLSIATLTNEMRVFIWHTRDRQWEVKPMTVPRGTKELLFSSDSRYLMTMGTGQDLKVLDLTSFDHSSDLDLGYVTLLGELLSAKSIVDGVIVNLTSAEWLERWGTMKSQR